MSKYVTYTTTISTRKYDDYLIDDAVEFVYKAKTEEDAVYNFKKLLIAHENRLSVWKLIKLLFRK